MTTDAASNDPASPAYIETAAQILSIELMNAWLMLVNTVHRERWSAALERLTEGGIALDVRLRLLPDVASGSLSVVDVTTEDAALLALMPPTPTIRRVNLNVVQ